MGEGKSLAPLDDERVLHALLGEERGHRFLYLTLLPQLLVLAAARRGEPSPKFNSGRDVAPRRPSGEANCREPRSGPWLSEAAIKRSP